MSASIDALVADERRVLWQANGCVLTAATDAAAATAPAAGPRPRSELFFDGEPGERADRRGRVAALLRRVAAAALGCRGTVRCSTTPPGGRSPPPPSRASASRPASAGA